MATKRTAGKQSIRKSSASSGNASRAASSRSAASTRKAAAKGSSTQARRKTTAQRTGSDSTAAGALSHTTTDHDEIRAWAEARGAHPACVKGTGGKGDIGMLRLDFPGYSEDKLQPIEWDDFFEKFDERDLALVYQEKTADGAKSNFNKLISRTGSEAKPKTRAAR
jgi:hypothetical protein